MVSGGPVGRAASPVHDARGVRTPAHEQGASPPYRRSFTDLALLADQAGIDIGAGLSGARSLDITRAYVRAFLDQHLRGTPQALLDQPSPRYPEVTSCSPEAETRA